MDRSYWLVLIKWRIKLTEIKPQINLTIKVTKFNFNLATHFKMISILFESIYLKFVLKRSLLLILVLILSWDYSTTSHAFWIFDNNKVGKGLVIQIICLLLLCLLRESVCVNNMELCTKLNNMNENHFEIWDKNCTLIVSINLEF